MKIKKIITISIFSVLTFNVYAGFDVYNQPINTSIVKKNDASNSDAYLKDSRGQIVKSGAGYCWRTSSWTKEKGLAECGDEVVANVFFENDYNEPISIQQIQYKETKFVYPQQVLLSSEILFDFNKKTLTKQGVQNLEKLITQIKDYNRNIQFVLVNAHSDKIGADKYNLNLSRQRAESVVNYLVAAGIDPAIIEAKAWGESAPLVNCDEQKNLRAKISCLAANRRATVEVKLHHK